jgi:heterodisulfide reductase subunit A-like polyferredoxin
MEKIVIIGAGVAGVNAATKLVDNGYPGEKLPLLTWVMTHINANQKK